MRRTRWIVTVVGIAATHFVIERVAGVGSRAAIVCTDLSTILASAAATIACARTARHTTDHHNRIAWYALAAGTAAWCIAAMIWSVRELVLGEVAPPPSWYDAPFFLLAPSFAFALVFYRRRRPSRRLQLRQVADLGIVTATIAIAGTLVLADPIRQSDSNYVFVAIGYPGFYLAVVLVALGSLARGSWGSRRIVLGILIWANLAFATVDLLYGAKVLSEVYQTGIEDTLWLIGMLSMCWAATEERALLDSPESDVVEHAPTWNAVVGAIALVALTALAADAIGRLEGSEWTIIAVAAITAAGFVGLRMWTGDRAEDAYLDAVSEGEQTQRVLSQERAKLSQLRAVSSLAGGTAHEVNNLLQAIAGNVALLRRRAARGEDIQAYLRSIEKALAMLGGQVGELRKLGPVDSSTHGMVLILPGGDRDGSLTTVLADAGFAPASLPDIDSVLRASKGHSAYAVIASPEEGAILLARGLTIPIIHRTDNVVDAVVALVALVSAEPPR